MNIRSSQIIPKPQRPKMVTVSPMDRTNGGPMYKVTINTDVVKDVGVSTLKSVAGATSAVAHAPLTLVGPLVTPRGYDKSHQTSTALTEAKIFAGASAVAGALITGLATGGTNMNSLMAGGVIGGAVGFMGYIGALNLNSKEPLLLHKIADAKVDAAKHTGGEPTRKAGAALREAYETGFQESWKRGEDGLEASANFIKETSLAGLDFADGFLHPRTDKS